MRDVVMNRISSNLTREVLRRLLIKYFVEKGYTKSFDLKLYPPELQDISKAVPELNGLVEISPSAENVDPRNGYAKLRWDLFVLGNQRLFLGFTEHSDLSELAQQIGAGHIEGGNHTSSYESTPIRVIDFILRTLDGHELGQIRRAEQKPGLFSKLPNMGVTFFRGSPLRQ